MRVVRRLVLFVVAVAIVGTVAPVLLPSDYHVERAIDIDAEPARIHVLVADLSEWDRWTPWRSADPSLSTTVSRARGVGAHLSWVGSSGDGELTVTASDPATGIVYEMTFDGGRRAGTGSIRYAASPGGTRVTWSMDGRAGGWFGRYFAALMDRMVGPMFEDGLAELKSVAETPAARADDAAEPS